jgi:hypothetical protein
VRASLFAVHVRHEDAGSVQVERSLDGHRAEVGHTHQQCQIGRAAGKQHAVKRLAIKRRVLGIDDREIKRRGAEHLDHLGRVGLDEGADGHVAG